MAIWDIFTRNKTSRYAIVDVEVGLKDHKIHDIGAFRQDGATFHKASKEELFEFLHDTDYLCGHNIHSPRCEIPVPRQGLSLDAGGYAVRITVAVSGTSLSPTGERRQTGCRPDEQSGERL